MKWALFAVGFLAACSADPKYSQTDLEMIACIAVAVVCFAAAAAIEIAGLGS